MRYCKLESLFPFCAEERGLAFYRQSQHRYAEMMHRVALGNWTGLAILRPAAILIPFLLATLVVHATRYDGDVVSFVAKSLYLVPIAATAFFYGRDAALFASLAVSAIFLPLLAAEYYQTGLSLGVFVQAGLLVTYNLLAVLISSWFELRRRHVKLLDTIQLLGEVIEKAPNLQGLLPLVLQQSMRLCDAEGAEIYLRRGAGPSVAAKAGRSIFGADKEKQGVDPPPYSLLGWLYERNEATILSDWADDLRFDLPAGALGGRMTLLSVPLQKGPQPAGLLALWRFGDRRFTREDANALSILAEKSRILIENASQYTQTDRALPKQGGDLSLLLDAGTAFSSVRTLDDLLQALCRKMAQSVESTFCRISFVDEGEQTYVIRAAFAVRALKWESELGRTFPVETLPWHERVRLTGEPVILLQGDAANEVHEPERSLFFSAGARSTLLMPLAVKERVIGVATLGEMRFWERTSFTREKIELCRTMARHGALAIENTRASESMARQSERMRLLIENVGDGIFRTDLEGRLLTLNAAAQRITGYSAVELIGRRCSQVFEGTSLDGYPLCDDDCPLRKAALSAGANPIQGKEWIRRRDGARILVHHNAAPFIDGDGRVAGCASIIRDVSHEEELVRLKSEFVSLVSHELRNPLTNIGASAELLAHADLSESDKKDMLQTLNRECVRLTRLVDQVLKASRLEKGRVKLTLEPLALIPLIEETVGMHRSLHGDYAFEIKAARRLPFALGDLASVQVILENLIQNAINYSPPGGLITISIEEQADSFLISVADRGEGVPAAQLRQIFNKFHRVTDQSTRNIQGFGLGLYIARMLTEAQGGKIWAECRPGGGSCFCFTLEKLEGLDEENPDH